MIATFKVCASFHDDKNKEIYKVTKDMLHKYIEDVPEAIRQDLLFNMLVKDGSLVVIDTEAKKKEVENDPLKGVSADGKKEKPAKAKTKKDGDADKIEDAVTEVTADSKKEE